MWVAVNYALGGEDSIHLVTQSIGSRVQLREGRTGGREGGRGEGEGEGERWRKRERGRGREGGERGGGREGEWGSREIFATQIPGSVYIIHVHVHVHVLLHLVRKMSKNSPISPSPSLKRETCV